MRIVLSVPATNDRSPLYTDQALTAIHQANPGRLPFHLGIARVGDRVSLTAGFPPELRAVIEGQLFAQYPECRIEEKRDPPALPPGHELWTADLSLKPDFLPIRRYGAFEDPLNRVTADPVTALLTAISRERSGQLVPSVEIVAQPASTARRRRAARCVLHLGLPFFRSHKRFARLYTRLALSGSRFARTLAWLLTRSARKDRALEPSPELRAAGEKLDRPLFEVAIRLRVAGPVRAERLAAEKLREMAGTFGLFASPGMVAFTPSETRRAGRPSRRTGRGFLLSAEELATLWHPPTQAVRAEKMARVESREFEPPATLPTPDRHPALATLGTAAFRSQRDRFGLLPDDRMRHIYVAGKTGMGKSTLLYNLILSDIAAGRGVALIDPHGDLAESLLPALPRSRTNDVILFDASDSSHPLAFNPLHCPQTSQRPLVASGIVSAFKKLYGDSWGPRLEHILRNSLLALLEVPGSTLVSILRLLSEAKYRQAIVSQLSDPIVRSFWQSEFAAMHPKLQVEAIAPIQNKVGHFVSSPLLRNIIAQPTNRLNLRTVMDERRVLIVNLSKGRIGEDSSALLGSLLVTSLQIAAMSRADIPEHERCPFHVYVDEFQNFATDSFATILSEARKYRLSLTIANQYLDQVEEGTAAAVFGNVGTVVAFQVGARDAETIAEQLGGGVTPQDLMMLPRFTAYARLLIDGQPSRPFSMLTLPPTTKHIDPKRAEIIRRYSRQRYGRHVAAVESGIRVGLHGS